ncbi:MAG TPA: hypothetical protein VFX45_06205 [Solirubrobacterales bacterium]|nr:hypothetical protein [Solirubrobacterales bacterium]
MRRRLPALATAGLAVLALVAGGIPTALAAFGSRAENGGNSVTAANDFRPPLVSAVAIQKSTAGSTVAGFVKQGGGYFVYANVGADTGNPASGIAGVQANVATVTTGSTAVPLVAGSFSAGGVAYGYRSAALTADAVLAEGAKAFTVSAADNAGNASSLGGSVTVDNTTPKASDVQTTNAGTSGLAEQGDSLLLTLSEPIDPGSVLTGWTGAATSVVVRIVDNGLLGLPLGNDVVQVFDATNATVLPLGSIDLGRGDYASGLLGGNLRFGATGTPSTMSLSGNVLTVVLGTYGSTGLDPVRGTAAGNGTSTWTPTATPYDRAANAMATTAATETGAADKEF